MLSCILIIQAIANGCCDFLAQCILVRINHCTYHWHLFYWPIISSKIYRCWIVWGQDIRVVIIPSFLAIAYMGQSYSHLISQFQIFTSSSLAFWLTAYMTTALSEATSILAWVSTLIVTSLTVSMAVNALVTGLIMFKILRVFLKVKPICELASGSAQDTKIQVRHVIFITIESGMALFVVQLIRVVFSIVPLAVEPRSNLYILEYVGVIHQMFNVIIISVHIYFSCFTDNIYQGITPTIIMVLVSMSLSFDDKESFKEATESLCFPTFRSYGNPPSDPDTSSMPPQLGSQGQPEERSDLSEGGVHVAIS